MNYKTLLVGMAIAIPMLITGCGGGGNSGKDISVAITTAPPATLEVNQSASIAATVTMDSSNSGVDWTCTPTGTCGTFAPAHTASGSTTIYTAPRTAGPVSIIATSTKNSAKSANAPITITAVAAASNLSGTYTFFVNGSDLNQAAYSVVGSIVINGATGTITGGEQDYFDLTTPAPTIFPADHITMGSITVGSDGRGTLSLTPTNAPVETLSITVVNDKHILITEFDANETAGGSLDLQTAPTSVPTGGNAFALLDHGFADAFGGVFTSNGTTITASEADDDLGGIATFDFPITTGSSFTAPDPNGRGTLTLNDPNLGAFELAYYVVGPEAFRLIEFDGNGFAVGSMYGQGAGAFSASSLGSKFAFGEAGVEDTLSGIGSYAVAGQFAGNGTILSSGVADINEGDGMPLTADALTGSTYVVHANGYGGIALSGAGASTDGLANLGVYLVDPAINVTDPNGTSGGGGAVMLDLDSDNIGVGIVVPQTTGAAFAGNYAFNQDGVFETPTAFALYGLVGQIVSDGTSKVAGLADYNELGIALTPAVTLAGTYTADAANSGRSTMQLTINGAATANNLTLYQASSSLVLHVDVDSTTPGFGTIGLGVFEQQQ